MFDSGKIKIAGLLQVRNGEKYLKGYFDNVLTNTNFFIVIDDGSADQTLALLKEQKPDFLYQRVDTGRKHIWNEALNRKMLVSIGQATGADWFLALDADERIQQEFYDRIPEIVALADQNNCHVVNLNLRESWNDAQHYRTDGIWGKKKKAIFFRNLMGKHVFDKAAWHGEWYSAHLDPLKDVLQFDLDILHLKMIRADDRLERMNLYKQLDPDSKFQSIGYEYLVDEANIQLEKIDYEVKGLY